jgi:hypothetical protein
MAETPTETPSPTETPTETATPTATPTETPTSTAGEAFPYNKFATSSETGKARHARLRHLGYI